jgi:hypothetical protein
VKMDVNYEIIKKCLTEVDTKTVACLYQLRVATSGVVSVVIDPPCMFLSNEQALPFTHLLSGEL